MTQPVRSIYDRMTKPTPEDLAVGDRIKALTPVDIGRMIDHLAQSLQHLADQRPDLTVTNTRDDHGWTIRVDLTPLHAGPMQIGNT